MAARKNPAAGFKNYFFLVAIAVATTLPPARSHAVELKFADPELKARYDTLAACFQELAGPGSLRREREVLGNFVESEWCSVQNCETSPRERVKYELYTLTYKLPDVFGLGFSADRKGAPGGWNVRFSYSEGGKGVIGEHFFVTFSKVGDRSEDVFLTLPTTTYEIHETTVHALPEMALWDRLRTTFRSAEDFKKFGSEQARRLADKVKKMILSHGVQKCEYGEYHNDGIPPECHSRPLTPEEEKLALAEAEAHFKEYDRRLAAHAGEWFSALTAVVPAKRCF